VLKRPAFTLALVALLGAVFLYGVIALFALGYRTGEVYPPYSSLRADPLGAKVLYEALDDLPGISVQRNFRPLPRLAIEEPVTLVYAGIPRRVWWAPEELNACESRVSGGARAVFAFRPAGRAERETEEPSDARGKKLKERLEKREEKEKEEKEKGSLLSFDEVAKRWAVRFDYLPASTDRTATGKAVSPDGREIAWHSMLYFADLGPEWTTLFTCQGRPAVVERKFGAGSLVLAADAFPLSNEAQRSDRQPALLGQLFAGPPRIVFDEEHLGVREQPGIANLARKYHLHGTVAALLLLAALFVWKNAAPFLPPREDPAADGIIAGKESGEGFVNLLRRTIAPRDLLGACVDEWRKTATVGPAERARLEGAWAAEQARPRKERDAVAAYRALAAQLARGTGKTSNTEHPTSNLQ
jgi:hypothetical protein